MKSLFVVTAISTFALIPVSTLAQTSPNDTCATAIFVSDGVNGMFNNGFASTDTTVSCSASALDVWFRYVASRAGTFVISTCTPPGETAGSMADTVLSIHADCSGAAPLACNDDSCGTRSSITIGLQQGVTYWIRVASGFLMFPLGSFWLTVDPPAPPNDDCSSAGLPVLSNGINPAPPAGQNGYRFSCVDATTSQLIGTPCPAFNEIWFNYTAAITGPISISTCTPPGFDPGSLADTQISVHAGGCVASTDCNDNSCGTLSSVTFAAVAGALYKVQVGGTSVPAEGTFYLTVRAPANDACGDAIAIGDGLVVGDNSLASTDASAPASSCGSGPGKDVWYTYTNSSVCTRQVAASLCAADGGSATFDSVLRAFTGACGSLTEIGCNDDFCGTRSRLVFTSPPGTTQWISVASDGNGPGGAFTLAVSHTCASAAQVAAGCTQGGGAGPTLSSNPPVLGTTLTLAITGALANAGGALFYGSPFGGSTPLPNGCTFSLDPFAFNILFTIGTNGSGAWSFSAFLPNDPALECASVDLQALLFPAGTYQVTSCLRLVLGH